MRSNSRLLAVFLCLIVAGACFAQGGGRQRGNRQRNNFAITALIFRADVQTDLAITPDEKTKLDGLRETLRPRRGGGGGAGGGGGTPPTPEERAAQAAEAEKSIDAVLTPDQSKRLREIQIQLEGPLAVIHPKVQTDLGLSADQISKIKTLDTDFRAANRAAMEKARNNEITREEATTAAVNNAKVLKENIAKVLTADQTSKLAAMGGKPFVSETPAAGAGAAAGAGR